MTLHTMESGESLLRLAVMHGYAARAVWELPENAELRKLRRRMDALAPGDEVYFPPRQQRIERCVVDQRHRFRRVGVPARIRVQLRALGQARSNLPYLLECGELVQKGTSDGDGLVEAFVPPDAREARLLLGEDYSSELKLLLGTMEPENTVPGVRLRLANLGIATLGDDDVASAAWVQALRAFQCRAGIAMSGQLDAATMNALRVAHDKLGIMGNVDL